MSNSWSWILESWTSSSEHINCATSWEIIFNYRHFLQSRRYCHMMVSWLRCKTIPKYEPKKQLSTETVPSLSPLYAALTVVSLIYLKAMVLPIPPLPVLVQVLRVQVLLVQVLLVQVLFGQVLLVQSSASPCPGPHCPGPHWWLSSARQKLKVMWPLIDLTPLIGWNYSIQTGKKIL